MNISERKLRLLIREELINVGITSYNHMTGLDEDKSGKGKCPTSGCIEKDGNGKWRIVSNKTGKYWPQEYKTKKTAESALDGYHASR